MDQSDCFSRSNPIKMASPYLTVKASSDFPDTEIICSESITFGETARQEMHKKRSKLEREECILNGVCALLNSGGGVLSLDIANSNYDYVNDGRGLDIERDLKDLVGSCIEDMVDFIPCKDSGKVYTYVRSWHSDHGKQASRLCSITTGLWERSGSNVECIQPSVVSVFLKKKKARAEGGQKENELCPPLAKRNVLPLPGNDIIRLRAKEFYKRNSVNLGERLGFGESMHVEFKQFGSEKIMTRLKEVIPKNISAFANTDGGFMFIGVDDRSQEVIGGGKGLNSEELLKSVREICKMPETVHSSDCTEVNMSWSPECKLIKVITEESAEANGYVVAIHVPSFCCAVFGKPPNCWHIDGGSVGRMEADVWLKRMQLSDPVDQSLSNRFQNVLSLKDAPPQCKPVYSIQTLTQLQEKIFPASQGITVAPETFRNKPLTSVVLNANSDISQGIFIFSQSWAVDINLHKNEDVLCEALIISLDNYPTLSCVVERSSPELWKYARDTACHLKQKLVNQGGYRGKLCVIPQLVERQSGETNQQTLYPNSYRLCQERDVKYLLHALVIVLMSFPSLLSDKVGSEFLNLLTVEQYGILQMYGQIKKLFIHGVPGSGKTLIAIQLIKMIKNRHQCEKDNILYLCENVGLREFVREKNLCQCETRVKFLTEDFPAVKHIIVDEAQNFRVEKGEKNWYKKALQLTGDGGMLWIFLDYHQQSHNFPDGLPPISEQSTVMLYNVVRNSVEVHKAMQCEMDRIIKGRQSEKRQHLADINSKMALSHSVPGFYKRETIAANKEVDYLIKELKSLFHLGYSEGDVAILFSTQQQLDKVQVMLNSLPGRFNSVEKIVPNEMVLDTVRRFSGLERNVVFLVNASVHAFQKNLEPNFLVSAYSRARMRLYVTFR